MKRRKFASSLALLAIASCNPRLDKRKKRYDEKECPFCVPKPGVCGYCDGKSKCSFCNGTGKRKVSTKNYPQRGIKQMEYLEDCPYCKTSGKCRYCDGVGKCWACKGTGRIESWDFFNQHQKEKSTQKSEEAVKNQKEILDDTLNNNNQKINNKKNT